MPKRNKVSTVFAPANRKALRECFSPDSAKPAKRVRLSPLEQAIAEVKVKAKAYKPHNELFEQVWLTHSGFTIDIDGFVREHRYMPGRRYRADFAHPKARLLIEVDGGNRMVRRTKGGQMIAVGRHTGDADYWKVNEASAAGWFVMRFTPKMLRSEPARCFSLVFDFLKAHR